MKHETKDLGPFFVQRMDYPETNGTPPRVERADTQEVEHPYRRARGWVFRYWGLHALVVGKWGNPEEDEFAALDRAIARTGRRFDPEEIGLFTRPDRVTRTNENGKPRALQEVPWW